MDLSSAAMPASRTSPMRSPETPHTARVVAVHALGERVAVARDELAAHAELEVLLEALKVVGVAERAHEEDAAVPDSLREDHEDLVHVVIGAHLGHLRDLERVLVRATEGLLEQRVLVDDPLLVVEIVLLVAVALALEPPEEVVLALLLAYLVHGRDLAAPALVLADVLDDLGDVSRRIVVVGVGAVAAAGEAGLLDIGEVVLPGAPAHIEVQVAGGPVRGDDVALGLRGILDAGEAVALGFEDVEGVVGSTFSETVSAAPGTAHSAMTGIALLVGRVVGEHSKPRVEPELVRFGAVPHLALPNTLGLGGLVGSARVVLGALQRLGLGLGALWRLALAGAQAPGGRTSSDHLDGLAVVRAKQLVAALGGELRVAEAARALRVDKGVVVGGPLSACCAQLRVELRRRVGVAVERRGCAGMCRSAERWTWRAAGGPWPSSAVPVLRD